MAVACWLLLPGTGDESRLLFGCRPEALLRTGASSCWRVAPVAQGVGAVGGVQRSARIDAAGSSAQAACGIGWTTVSGVPKASKRGDRRA